MLGEKLSGENAVLKEQIESIERRLNVRRRGRRDGMQEYPDVASGQVAETEADIIAAIESERDKLRQAQDQALQNLERDLRRAAPVRVNLAALFTEAEATLRQVESRLSRSFYALRSAEARTQRQLAAFRDANGLNRPPIYPESGLLQAALLAMAAAFEAMFSATLFATASEGGLLGGAAVALGLSGANVTLGFLAGFLGLRYLQHRLVLQKILGAACFLAAVAAAIGLNTFAAMWREGIEGARPLELSDRASLLGLTQPEAVILLMLGSAVWVFSALKGFSGFDDPYPDFGKLDRAARQASDAVEEGREELREALDEPLTTARAKAEEALDAQRQAVQGMREAYERTADRLLGLAARGRRLTEAGRALVQLYREENAAARKTPTPRSFSQPPAFQEPEDDSLHRAAALLGAAEEALHAAQAHVADGVGRLSDALHGIAERLEAPV